MELAVNFSCSVFETFEEIGKLDNQDYIGLLVEQGIMNDSQRKIYDDYKKFSLMAKKY